MTPTDNMHCSAIIRVLGGIMRSYPLHTSRVCTQKVLVGVMSPVWKDSGYLIKLASHIKFLVIMCELYYRSPPTGRPARKWKIHQVRVVPPSVEAFRK